MGAVRHNDVMSIDEPKRPAIKKNQRKKSNIGMVDKNRNLS